GGLGESYLAWRTALADQQGPLVADPQPQLGAGAVTATGDRVAGTGEADKALAVDVEQIAGTGPLVQPWPLARLPRWPRDPRSPERPPDGRVWVPGLAGVSAVGPSRC